NPVVPTIFYSFLRPSLLSSRGVSKNWKVAMASLGPDEIPEELARTAFHNGEEMAWQQGGCAVVIEWLRSSGYATLGMELWLPDSDGIRTAINTKAGNAIYCMACDPGEGEPWKEYVERSATATAQSIASFRWPEDSLEPPRPVYFNITWASRPWFREHSRVKFADD
ncbi:MAG: hypothetical protein ACRD51_11680, partial [Candidatus Acidiferrum sp.]